MMTKIIPIIIILSLFILSCKKPGCKDSTAKNYSSKVKTDDGSCVYPRDVFLGTYKVNETCVWGEDQTYTLKVIEGPNTNEVIIDNLNNNNIKIKGVVSSNQIIFKENILEVTYEGKAYMVSSEIYLTYTACETYYYPCSEPEACSLSGKK